MKKICFFIGLSHLFIGSLFSHIYSYKTPLEKYLKSFQISENKSGIAGVDCIYVINLDKRREKWDRMKKLCEEQGLKINRVSGINGWKIPFEICKELAGPYPVRMRGGSLGCLLSHISVIKDAWERNFEVIWVMEDDLEFIEDIQWIPYLLGKLNKIDPYWDIFFTDVDSKDKNGNHLLSLSSDFRFDQDHYPLEYYIEKIPVDEDIMMIRQRFGMYSFLITRRGMEKVLDYFTHVYLWTAVDIDIHYIPYIREYSARKDIISVWCNSIFSDTGVTKK